MIDIANDYPQAEDFHEGIRRAVTQISELTNDILNMSNKFINGDYFMTEEDVAKYFHCEVSELPNFRRYRPVYGRGYLYKKREVDEYVAKKAVGKM